MAARGGPRLTAADGRRFAWTLAAGFVAVAALALWRGRLHAAWVLAALGAAALLAGAAVPTRLGPVQRGWSRVGDALSRVTRPVVLTVLYWVVLTPVGVVRRAAGRSPLARSRAATTYWVRRDAVSPDDARRGLERMF